MNWKNHKLKQYKIKAEKPFECIMCERSFKTQDELSEHQHYDCTGGW